MGGKVLKVTIIASRKVWETDPEFRKTICELIRYTDICAQVSKVRSHVIVCFRDAKAREEGEA